MKLINFKYLFDINIIDVIKKLSIEISQLIFVNIFYKSNKYHTRLQASLESNYIHLIQVYFTLFIAKG